MYVLSHSPYLTLPLSLSPLRSLSVPSANSNHSGVYVCVVRVEGGVGELERSENVTVIVIIGNLLLSLYIFSLQ